MLPDSIDKSRNKLVVGTTVIDVNEPCLGLTEVNLLTPDSRFWHRFQIIYVIRGDMPAECRIDLGPRESFKVEEFRIPGGFFNSRTKRGEILHTVGELMAIAEELHQNPLAFPRAAERRQMIKEGYI